MFSGLGRTAKVITALDLTHFDTSSLTNASYMFQGNSHLKTINLSTWIAPNLTNVDSMFYNCSGLTKLDIRGIDFTKTTSYNDIFYYVPTNCRVIVKDEANKEWCIARRSFTNIVTVDEL
jgi:surface protein